MKTKLKSQERAGIPNLLKIKGLLPSGAINRMDKLNDEFGMPMAASNDDLDDPLLDELLSGEWADPKQGALID